MKYYKVTSLFFDNGKTAAYIEEIEAEKAPKATFESGRKCDIYQDYFGTETEALQYMQDTLNA